MSRCYDVTFTKPDCGTVTTRGYGNTRTSAERSARGRLRDLGLDPRQCHAVRFSYVPHEERDGDISTALPPADSSSSDQTRLRR